MTKAMLAQMVFGRGSMAAGTLYLFSFYHAVDYWKGVTVSLTTLAVFQWYNGFNCQFLSDSIFSKSIFRNPYLWIALLGNVGLQSLAIYTPVYAKDIKNHSAYFGGVGDILGVSLLVILVEEIRKLVYRLFFEPRSKLV